MITRVFITCYDLLGQNEVSINPNNVDFIALITEEKTFTPDHNMPIKAPVTVPIGAYHVKFVSGGSLLIAADGGKKLKEFVAPPLYTLDAKTLFQYNTEEEASHEEQQLSPPTLP